MTDIFISYSRKDVEMVTILARTLEELGYSVWWDVSGLHGGQSFARVIQEKLAEAKCAIVVWSPDSVKSNWVHSEASFADNRGILVTAVYREAYAPMPFNNRHNENLRGWSGNVFDEGFQKLINAVHRHCPVPSGRTKSNDAATESPSASSFEAEQSQKEIDKQELTPAKKKLNTGTKAAVAGVAAGVIAVGAYFLIPSKTIDDDPIQSPTAVPDVSLEQTKTVVNTDKKVPPLVKSINEPLVTDTKIDFTKISGSFIESAKIALKENRLFTPENNSVVSYARLVLKADPQNEEIKSVLVQATSNLHGLAELDFMGKSYLSAKSYLKESQKIIDEFSLVQSQATQDAIANKFGTAFTDGLISAAKKAASSKVYKLENNLTLLPIPAGDFMMGSNSGADDQKPVHKVTFSKPFWMSKSEITFDQYDAYAKATDKSLPNDENWGGGTRPVINVSWDDSQGYVNWLSQNNSQRLQCRLPSEAEWEYAARAGSTSKYPWGDTASHEKANYGTDVCCEGFSKGRDQWINTAQVGSFPENKWGLQDMHGNVWEWVQDPWHKNYQGAPVNGEVWGNGVDESRRVLRGGSWNDAPFSLPSAYRGGLSPDYRSGFIGFRVVCSPPSVL